MDNLNSDKLQRLLDYHLGLDEPQQRRQTEKTTTNDTESQSILKALEATFSPLDALDEDQPPEGLAQRTIEFARQHRQAQNLAKASAAMAKETNVFPEGRARWIISNLKDMAAVAICMIALMLVTTPGVKYARSISQQNQCASQIGQIGQAYSQYAAANNGNLPQVKRNPNSVWWRINAKERNAKRNASNTMSVYLLVKNGYITGRVFICPSVRPQSPPRQKWSSTTLKQYDDFAGQDYINYSVRITGPSEPLRWRGKENKILLTDQNPLFANFNSQLQHFLRIPGDSEILKANSPNHNGRGQHLLSTDGSVRFSKDRYCDITGDDFFTIRSVYTYYGHETPLPDDNFIAP